MIIIVLLLILIAFYLFKNNQEHFETPIVIYDDTEFRGINLLGISSEDGVIHTENIEECATECLSLTECKGFSYFKPNGDCYLFGSGDVIPNDQGFAAGKKI